MKHPVLKIVVLNSAKKGLKEIHDYIESKSPQNAKMVKDEVLKKIDSLALFPQKFPSDPFLHNTMDDYRFTIIKNIRILYRVEETRIVVFKIIHSQRNPESFSAIKGDL